MTLPPPLVSVVIPTHDRARSVQRTLVALERQTYPREGFEVVVVANGCSDGTAATVRALATPLARRLVELPAASAGPARNRGAAVADGGLLVFVDDDVEPLPGFVQAHVRAHERAGDGLVVVGALLAPELPGRRSLFEERLRRAERDFSLGRAVGVLDWSCVAAGNMSVSRALFEAVGGFARSLPGYGGEDYEFAFRAQATGARFTYAAAAGGYHHQHENTSLAGSLRKIRSRARNDVISARALPGIVARLPLATAGRSRSSLGALARACAFEHRRVGDAAAAAALAASHLLAWARWRRPWTHVVDGLHRYWYLRGVADELGSRRALACFLDSLDTTHRAAAACDAAGTPASAPRR